MNKITGYGCPLILSRFDFAADGINHCCTAIGAAGTPKACTFDGGEFPFEAYLKSSKEYIQNNLRQEGACKSCQFLQHATYSTQFEGFNYISINNWSRCHLKCYYCSLDKAAWRKNKIKPYNPLPALKSLYDRGWIRAECMIDFGGGEPSVYDHLDDVLHFVMAHELKCHINTNAVIFSQSIADALRNHPQLTITISPDAGTPESYKRVKGQDLFKAVSKNIKRYSQIGDVNLKYNVTPYANSPEDIQGIVEILKESRIKSFRISPELHAYTASYPGYGRLIRFARELYNSAIKVQAVVALPFWSQEDANFIHSASSETPSLTETIQQENSIKIAKSEPTLTKIVFMLGDFTPAFQLEQLNALLRLLPTARFFTIVLLNTERNTLTDTLQLCNLLADIVLSIKKSSDAELVKYLREQKPDILIDMEAYGPTDRLAVFMETPIPHKFLWGEAPMPSIAPQISSLAGARLGVEGIEGFPVITLPEMGEYYALPELPFERVASHKTKGNDAPVFGCLTPAAGIGRDGWQLFAEAIRQHPGSKFIINLDELSDPAQDFIGKQFARADIAPERLEFRHIKTAEDLCRAWQSIDVGLAPPVNPGGLALPACLWMGKPYLALASHLPWSQRPAALLRAVDKAGWIAGDEGQYAELAWQIAAQGRPAPDPALRERMKALGLCDPAAFACGFANAMPGHGAPSGPQNTEDQA